MNKKIITILVFLMSFLCSNGANLIDTNNVSHTGSNSFSIIYGNGAGITNITRTNIVGAGTAVTNNTGDFATAAQGANADASLLLYYYGTTNITITPTNEFGFDGAGTITNYTGAGTSVVIPYAINNVPVTTIGDEVFISSGLLSFRAPICVTKIKTNAFSNCNSLTNVIAMGVTNIEFAAFYYNYALKEITFPALVSVGKYAFDSCYTLKNISLPEVRTIGEAAFQICTGITNVSLPKATYFGGNTFTSCSNLVSVSFGQRPVFTGVDFGICSNLTSVTFECDLPPAEVGNTYIESEFVTNYVMSLNASAWDSTFESRPVVLRTVVGNYFVAGNDAVSHGNGSITAGGGFYGDGVGISNITYASYNPYIIAYAPSVTLSIANGNYQFYGPTNTTTLYLPNPSTNLGYAIWLAVNPGTNSFTLNTNNLCFTTNDVIGVGPETVRIRTNNETTTLIFMKDYLNVNWRVTGL